MKVFAPQRRWYDNPETGLLTIRRHPEARSRYRPPDQIPPGLKHALMAQDEEENVSCPTCGCPLIGEDDD